MAILIPAAHVWTVGGGTYFAVDGPSPMPPTSTFKLPDITAYSLSHLCDMPVGEAATYNGEE